MEYYCKIRWNDTNKEEFQTIAVGEHNGNAFFTCKTNNELRHLMNEDNGEKFVVLQINGNDKYQADKTTFQTYLKQMAELDKAFNAMCKATRTYCNMVKEMLKDGKERCLENGYGEYDEPLSIICVDNNGTGADNYQLDKARYNSDKDCVEFHVVAYNYDETDEWIASYFLGSEETYAFGNIMF